MQQVRPYGICQRGASSGTYVYRFTRSGEPIYVGVTSSIPERWQAHKTCADWWPLVDHVELVAGPFKYMASALRAEVELIKEQRPIGNRRSLVTPRREVK